MKRKKDIIIQARMGSERLLGKVMKNLCGKPMISQIYDRAIRSKYADNVIIATTIEQADDEIYEYCIENGIKVFRGDEQNVLSRYYECAKENKSEIVMRLTGDNALVDHKIVDEAFTFFENNDYQYVYYRQGLPLGLGVEVFDFATLQKAFWEADDHKSLEHVTYYMYTHKDISSIRVPGDGLDYSDIRLTTDTKEDWAVISEIYKALYYVNPDFSLQDVLKYLDSHKELLSINQAIKQRS